MNKKERVIAAIRGDVPDHVPVGFSLHFPRTAKTVEEDLKFHLDFFRETDTDIIKIMNENLVPDFGEIRTPDDWNKIPALRLNWLSGLWIRQIRMPFRWERFMEFALLQSIRLKRDMGMKR